tara:strand:+ start:122 stop:622 length:501 start_codon:yes stop_codon:yes gene_type:complete
MLNQFKQGKLIILIVFFMSNFSSAQSDTIYTTDTIISSVRIMNQDENFLRYFYLDSIGKQTKTISLEKIKKLIYENDKIEVFCDLVSTKKFLGRTHAITINYGNRDSLWLDQKIQTLTETELKKYNSIIDALNYMGNEGWKTISSYSTSYNSYIVEHYILKKEIKK